MAKGEIAHYELMQFLLLQQRFQKSFAVQDSTFWKWIVIHSLPGMIVIETFLI